MGKKFENILETVGNTPVVRINKLAPDGINLFVKVEAFNPLGSVKDRLALGIIENIFEFLAHLVEPQRPATMGLSDLWGAGADLQTGVRKGSRLGRKGEHRAQLPVLDDSAYRGGAGPSGPVGGGAADLGGLACGETRVHL